MNRRSFFANLLGAACLAVAQRVMPSALTKLEAPEGNTLREAVEASNRPMSFNGVPIMCFDQILASGVTDNTKWLTLS